MRGALYVSVRLVSLLMYTASAQVTYLVHCDLIGAVPAWLTRRITNRQPMLIRSLREFFRF